MPRDNLRMLRLFIDECWSKGDIDRVPEFVHDSYAVSGQLTGVEGVQSNIRRFRTAFPDLTILIERHCMDGESISALMRFQGTHLGEWNGWPPSRREIDYREAGFFLLRGGKIAEGDFVADTMAIRIQIGALPASSWTA